MDGFEKWWKRVAVTRDGQTVSPELRPLLQKVYQRLTKKSPVLLEIKSSLENLLFYLTTTSGRTTANCFATDLFFTLADWDIDWEVFPESLTEIIGDMGGALHDTVAHPEIAANFRGLPEELLLRIQQWKLD